MITPKELRAAWVKALRSGEYKQTKGWLRKTIDGESKYCCLGVACEVAIKNGLNISITRTPVCTAFNNRVAELPNIVCEAFGVSATGRFTDSINGRHSLSALNDRADYTFDQIADVIESGPKGLFREEQI